MGGPPRVVDRRRARSTYSPCSADTTTTTCTTDTRNCTADHHGTITITRGTSTGGQTTLAA